MVKFSTTTLSLLLVVGGLVFATFVINSSLGFVDKNFALISGIVYALCYIVSGIGIKYILSGKE